MHPLSTTQLPDGLLMVAAQIPIVPAEGFNPNDHLYAVEREDGGACVCGQWYFYSATCGGDDGKASSATVIGDLTDFEWSSCSMRGLGCTT